VVSFTAGDDMIWGCCQCIACQLSVQSHAVFPKENKNQNGVKSIPMDDYIKLWSSSSSPNFAFGRRSKSSMIDLTL
jgi:hypothetical protein